MRIWTTVIGQRIDDAGNTRSMLLCDELIRRGHEVTMWTSAYDHIRKQWRTEWRASGGEPLIEPGGLRIRFMKGCGYKRNISIRRFLDHALAARDFLRQAEKLPAPDVIVASLPDHITASAAIDYGKRHGVPVIIDVRDKWPDILIDYASERAIGRLIKPALLIERRRAARALRSADAILGMMRSMRDWGLSLAGRPATPDDRVFYLTTSAKNFGDAPRPPIPAHSAAAAAIEATRGKMVFAFTGTFNRTVHPLLILDAIDLLEREGRARDDIAFVIAGDGVDAGKVVERAAAHPNVHVTGWLTVDEMQAVLRGADVGLAPSNYSSPGFHNKASAYIASGLPIINSAPGDLAELIDSEELGLNVAAGDARALADAIQRLAENPETVAAMSQRMQTRYSASFDRAANYSAYADHVEKIAASRRR